MAERDQDDTAPAARAPRVSVIVPTLDEAENIDELIERVLAAGVAADLAFEVIVVDDGSEDGTRERVRQWGNGHPVRLLARDGERGLSEAVLAGARIARGEVVAVIDADLSHPPEKLGELVRPVLDGSVDMAIGSRYVPGGGTPGWPWVRRLASRGASVLARFLTDARDPMSGYFAVRRERMLAAGANAKGFKIGLEVLVRSGEGIRLAEIPIQFHDRTRGTSKVSGRVAREYIAQLLALAGGAASATGRAAASRAASVAVVLDIAVFVGLFTAGLRLADAQLASFVAGGIGALVAVRRRTDGERAHARGLPFAVVALLTFFLRAAVLGLLVHQLAVPAVWSIAIAAGVSGVFAAVAWALTAIADPGRQGSGQLSWRAVAALGVPYLLLLRVVGIGQFELLPQEAYYWNYAQHIDIGYLDHPPMVAWLIWLTTRLGHTEFLVRLPAIASWLIALAFSFLFVRNVVGRGAALRAALLLAALPFFFGAGVLMMPDAPLLACWAALLYFFERVLLGGRQQAWWGIGLFVGLGMLSKYSIVLVPFAAFLFIVFDRRARRCLLSPLPFAAVVLSLLVFAPVLIWNQQHDWASFTFQSSRRLAGRGFTFDLPEFVLYVLALLTPLGIAGLVAGLRQARGVERSSAVLDGRARKFVLVFTLAPLAVFGTTSVWAETKLNWTGPIFLAALPAIAVGMGEIAGVAGRSSARLWMDRGWKATFAVLMIGYGFVFFYYPVHGVPGVAVTVQYFTAGWQDVGQKIEAIEARLERETGERAAVVGLDKYHTTSALAFYVPREDYSSGVVGRHVITGRNALMYEFWCKAQALEGKNLILVDDRRDSLDDPQIVKRAERLGPVERLEPTRYGRSMRPLYVRVVYGVRLVDGS